MFTRYQLSIDLLIPHQFLGISSNIFAYSVREQADAIKVKDLSKYMGYPSPQSLIDMINQGAIVNCPVTAKDVARANNIFDPDLASV